MPPGLVCYASQMTRATSITDNLINKRVTFDDLMELNHRLARQKQLQWKKVIRPISLLAKKVVQRGDQQDGRRRPCERYIVFVSFSTKSRYIGIAANFAIFNKYQLLYVI